MTPESEPLPVLFETIATAGGHRFGRATLNAPASLHALTLPMVDRLDPQLAAWAADPSIAGVVLDATGDKAFCAGGDVVGLHDAIRATPAGQVPALAKAFFEREYRLDHRIHRYPKPLVCWGHGIVMGGGIGLMAGASHRVATPATRWAMPEIAIGLHPDVGGSWLLPRMPGRIGRFLALTGATCNAADARQVGLATALLRHEDHAAVLADIAATVWTGNPADDAAQLDALLEARAVRDGVPASALERHRTRIDEALDSDDPERYAPRLAAWATDGDPWLARAADGHLRGSPTSAALALELQRRAAGATLADAFRLEWQASVGCCLHPDFVEGVRALLVDKDRRPRWHPATRTEVTPVWIENHLLPRFSGDHPLADLA